MVPPGTVSTPSYFISILSWVSSFPTWAASHLLLLLSHITLWFYWRGFSDTNVVIIYGWTTSYIVKLTLGIFYYYQLSPPPNLLPLLLIRQKWCRVELMPYHAKISVFRIVAAPLPTWGWPMQNCLAGKKGHIGRVTSKEGTHYGWNSLDQSAQLFWEVLQKEVGGGGGGRVLFEPTYSLRRVGGVLDSGMPWYYPSVVFCMRINGSPLIYDFDLNLFWSCHPPIMSMSLTFL